MKGRHANRCDIGCAGVLEFSGKLGGSGGAVGGLVAITPASGFVEMLKITPAVTACRLTIQLRPADGGCTAEIGYQHTSLGPRGDAFVAEFTAEAYRSFMTEWEERLNHYLRHGSAL